jgi:hypothetical protein
MQDFEIRRGDVGPHPGIEFSLISPLVTALNAVQDVRRLVELGLKAKGK